jgi:hypothetical protein
MILEWIWVLTQWLVVQMIWAVQTIWEALVQMTWVEKAQWLAVQMTWVVQTIWEVLVQMMWVVQMTLVETQRTMNLPTS